ncbi:hypothetical protein ABKN59_010863 [Abortiporus biennis]
MSYNLSSACFLIPSEGDCYEPSRSILTQTQLAENNETYHTPRTPPSLLGQPSFSYTWIEHQRRDSLSEHFKVFDDVIRNYEPQQLPRTLVRDNVYQEPQILVSVVMVTTELTYGFDLSAYKIPITVPELIWFDMLYESLPPYYSSTLIYPRGSSICTTNCASKALWHQFRNGFLRK